MHSLTTTGVHTIVHTASPISWSLKTYDEFVTIAIQGTETIFEASLKAGPQLEGVVVTSSLAAVMNLPAEPYSVFTEKNFSTLAFDKATADKAAGVSTHPGVLYTASKIAAERAVWEFKKKHNVSGLRICRKLM